MLTLFLFKASSIFAWLSPALAVGKFLDWHRKRVGQEKTKEALGDIYLKASYGTLFRSYCEQMIKALDRTNIFSIYAVILSLFFISGISINYFLFRDFNFKSNLISNYKSIAFALSFIGLLDFVVTKKLLNLAAKGRHTLALILSLPFIYISSVIAAATFTTFLLFLDQGMDLSFFIKFFINRIYVIGLEPITSSGRIDAPTGNYVYMMAFSFPAIAISTSTLVASSSIFLLSSQKLQPLYDYIADHIFTPEEKGIHLKLATLFCVIASALGAAIWMLF